MRHTASTGNKQSHSMHARPHYTLQRSFVVPLVVISRNGSAYRRHSHLLSEEIRRTSFFGKRAPIWSIILAVIVTAGAFGAATVAIPQLSDALQSQRDFTLSSTPPALTINQGSTAKTTVTVASLNGFDMATGLTTAVSLAGNGWILARLANNILTPSSGAKTDTILSVTALQDTPIGGYQVTISSSGGTKSHSITVAVTVAAADFTITPQPSSIRVSQNSYNTTTLILASQGGFSGNVSLSVTAPLASMGVAGGPSPVYLAMGGAATSTLAVQASQLTPIGTYSITITGTAGALTHSTNIQVVVTNSSIVSTGREALSLENSSFNSNTNATLYIRNTGTATITMATYYVKDASGNTYENLAWSGPVISANQVGATVILIGSSCSNCTLVGSPYTFMAGYSYTITIVTSRNNQFTFTIVR